MKQMGYYIPMMGLWLLSAHAMPLTEHDAQVRHAVHEAVMSLLNKYTRSITTFDFNAHDGHYSFDIAKNRNATCVMLAADEQNMALRMSLDHSTHNRIIVLSKKPSLYDLKRLSECEHFDLVLMLHGFDEISEWRETFESLCNSGDHCMLLIPLTENEQYPAEVVQAMRAYLEGRNARLLKVIPCTEHESWGLFLHTHKKPFGGRVHWNRRKLLKPGAYVMKSSFSTKSLYKPTTKKWTSWKPGINLRTFLALKGVYPTQSMVLKELRKFKECKHNDLTPCNMVVQGKEIILIDYNDPRRRLDPALGFVRLMKVFEKA